MPLWYPRSVNHAHVTFYNIQHLILDEMNGLLQYQVDSIPRDSYSLALYALDRCYNPRPKTAPILDFNLSTAPYITSRDKHHAIYRTAHGIMRRLDKVVHEVRYV